MFVASDDRAQADKAIEAARAEVAMSKPTLVEMIAAVADEAYCIECSQRALLIAGLRAEPHAPAIRRIVVLDAIHSLLGAMRTRPRDVIRWIERGAGP